MNRIFGNVYHKTPRVRILGSLRLGNADSNPDLTPEPAPDPGIFVFDKLLRVAYWSRYFVSLYTSVV